jgi:hypothetical protein
MNKIYNRVANLYLITIPLTTVQVSFCKYLSVLRKQRFWALEAFFVNIISINIEFMYVMCTLPDLKIKKNIISKNYQSLLC